MTKNELATLTELLHRLYGQNGFEGDMQEIKKSINHLTAVTVKTSERLCIHDTTLLVKRGMRDCVKWLKQTPIGLLS